MSTLFGKRPRTPKQNQNQNHDENDRKRNHAAVISSGNTAVADVMDGDFQASNDRNDHNEELERTDIEEDNVSQRGLPTSVAGSTKSAIAAASTVVATFADLGLTESLVNVCHKILSYKQPTPVQKTMIPFLLHPPSPLQRHAGYGSACITAATGSGKTASYLLPMIHNCMIDPTSIYAIVLAPTRELATQIHQQCVLFTTSTSHNTTMISSKCIVGGCDIVAQANGLYNTPPHIVITTPGRFATILQNPFPPRNIHKISYCIIDEADRIFPSNSSSNSSSGSMQCGFTSDMETILQHIYRPNSNTSTTVSTSTNQRLPARPPPRLLFYSATCTNHNYKAYQQIVNRYMYQNNESTTPLPQFIVSEDFVIHDKDDIEEEASSDNDINDSNENDVVSSRKTAAASATNTTTITTNIPNGLKQEYIFMPSQVRDAYLLGTIRTLLAYGGTKVKVQPSSSSTKASKKKQQSHSHSKKQKTAAADEYDDTIEQYKAQSAILFVSTCERAALVSELLKQVGVPNVALHSLVSTQQSIRNKVLHQFQSEYVRIIVATDIASRGLDLPRTDLVINVELTNITPMTYIHRIGRTARAGRRGRAISFVTEHDVDKVQNIERTIGTTLQSCSDMTDDIAMSMLSTTVKATRLAKLQLEQMNFHEFVQKMKERKLRDQQDRRTQQQFKNKK